MAINPSTYEAKAPGAPLVQGHPALHSKFNPA